MLYSTFFIQVCHFKASSTVVTMPSWTRGKGRGLWDFAETIMWLNHDIPLKHSDVLSIGPWNKHSSWKYMALTWKKDNGHIETKLFLF